MRETSTPTALVSQAERAQPERAQPERAQPLPRDDRPAQQRPAEATPARLRPAQPDRNQTTTVSSYVGDDLFLIPVCDHCWRVNVIPSVDGGISEVLGFVEERGECVFEVMQLTHQFTWTVFPTLDQALGFLWKGSRAAQVGATPAPSPT